MAKIFIIDEFTPQDNAMLQALYSRSPHSVAEHIQKVRDAGSGKFMERFYVGYGHASIADCGSTTVFIEGISILCDKAVQDWPLYSGQETSTRYVDMSKQPIIDPVGTSESRAIQAAWMDFYISALPRMEKFLKAKYPIQEGEKVEVYQKAINARSFDILRSFLPAGIVTQLSWHTNLRQAYDKLCWLKHNPIPEIKETAETILEMLKEKYAHSFSHQKMDEQENFWEETAKRHTYYAPKDPPRGFSMKTNIDLEELANYQDVIDSRPPKTGLPYFLAELGTVTFEFLLDFGSFRDIQRHRNGVCRQPLLTVELGFHPWYLGELPDDLKEEAESLISKQKEAISKLETTPELKQYYIALGFLVPHRVTYGLPATVYVTELRSGKMVHPTLRIIALKMREMLLEKFPKLVLHCDLDPSQWDISRGMQDIVEKK
ncbi:MAG: FAD-dependent thymidylate synthase [Candidatus Pacebacteria bacterium]|jgi:thymidylate synthase ThyX|nr:FAD-dependent thymidylate synthase [Candidatus Paceibacterota bacterium]